MGVARNQGCDGCGQQFTRPNSVRRLDTGGGSGLYLCRSCWGKEMAWRKQRNKTLEPFAKFPIRKFPSK